MPDKTRRHLILIAFAFEGGLGLLGVAIAWLAGIPLAQQIWPLAGLLQAIGTGLVATGPLVVLLLVLIRCRSRPIVDLLRQVKGLLRVLFARGNVWQVAAVALAAGFGEEILFRGALQPLVANWTSPLVGLVATSLLFGVVHAATPAYFAFATLVGFYLGGLALWTDEILSASIAHALYDFFAIIYLLAHMRRIGSAGP